MDKDIYVLEYSKEQKQYHVQTLEKRNSRPINGYGIIAYFNNEEDAFKAIEKHQKREIDNE